MSDEEHENNQILDLSKKNLKKVPKQDDPQNYRTLILDDNELQKIDNIDSYLRIEKLSLSKNQLLRMYGVSRLQNLRELNLSLNGILTIEGLKELHSLQYLNLEGNKIKTIEHLNTNTKLEYLNLSENSIGSISDISYLKSLKELYLHGNRLVHLRQCDKYLPVSIEILTLGKNGITDLNEICTLSNLCHLNSITINENPCVLMTGGIDGFDHRPFVLNWCMSVKIIDGFMVDPIESLKAEWLYSQGRGRQFRVGEQTGLARYLSSVCPLLGKALENENERKLRLILSKAQQHQRQLQEEISDNLNTSSNSSPSSGRKKTSSRIQSPRFSRLSGRQGSPESMSNSYHGNTSSNSVVSITNDTHSNQNHIIQMTTSLIENIKNDPMIQSFDANTLNNTTTNNKLNAQDSTPRTNTPNHYNGFPIGGPLAAASKMVPVPETLMSPDCCPSTVTQRVNVSTLSSKTFHTNTKLNRSKDNKSGSPKVVRSPHLKRNSERSPVLSPRKVNNNVIQNNQNMKSCLTDTAAKTRPNNSVHIIDRSGMVSSDDDSDQINVDKLKTIRNKAAQRNQQQKDNTDLSAMLNQNPEAELYAVVIQKNWRGYKSRKNTKDIAEKILKKRTLEYIEKLTKDMETTKAQLENERKIQQLQMHAINALWKKVSTMQGTTSLNVENRDSEESIALTNSTDPATAVPCTSQTNLKTVSLDNSSAAVVNDLTKTCTMLTTQVEQLQGSMRDILNCMTLFCNLPQENLKKLMNNDEPKDSAGTQTEIVAVHTPQVDTQMIFPYKIRPSSLPLEQQQQQQQQVPPAQSINSTDQKINNSGDIMNEDSNKELTDSSSLTSEKLDEEQEQSEEHKLSVDTLIPTQE